MVFTAEPSWIPIDLPELWHHRELLWFLTLRDIKIRYKQTLLGVAWAVIKPLVTMVVFTVLLGALLGPDNLPSEEGIPYVLSTFCGLVAWQLFARALVASSQSLTSHRNLLTKVYFPRLILPLAQSLGALVDFGIAFVVLVGLEIVYGVVPGPAVLVLPVLIILAMAAALAASLWLAALDALWRDIGHGLGFLAQLWMYATPVVYSTESVMGGQPEWLRVVYNLNPMVGVTEGFRWALLGGAAPAWEMVAYSAVLVTLVLTGGLFFFRRLEHVIADLV